MSEHFFALTVLGMTINDYENVVVTGASSGIGEAVARSLSEAGLIVHAIARRTERLDELAANTKCIVHTMDVCDSKAFIDLLETIEVDILINNAGVGRGFGNLVDANFEDIETTIDTNVKAAIYAAKAVLPGMVERRNGHLINIGSMAGLYPLASSLYGATKGATHVLSMDLRLELQGTGVRVTEICPGRVTTEFYDAALDDHAMVESKKNSGIKEVTSEDISLAVIYALDAPQHVNINRIELQPTEQTYGGMQFTPRSPK